jgi:hypothetical protein
MMQQEELAVLRAYQQAVSDVGGAGWTNCKSFIERRVHEMMQDDNSRMTTPAWRTDCLTKTLGYDAL